MSDMIIQTIITAAAVILTSTFSGLIVGSKVVYRIDLLEKKVDKHNDLIERMTRAEESTKSAHHRIDEMRDKG